MLEVILNSDIARLVLAYLREQCLEEASLVFCKTSPYLREEYRFLKKGFRSVALGPESLISIIREYCRIKSRVLQFLETLSCDDKYDFLEQPSLDAKILLLLKKSKYKPAEDSSKTTSKKNKKRRHSSSDTETNTVECAKLAEAKKRRLSNYFVCLDTSKDGAQTSSAGKSCTISSGSENEADTEGQDNSIPLEVPDFSDISEALLHNSEFPNKLADKINRVLSSTDKNVPTSSVSCSTKNPQENFDNLSAVLDDIIKNVVDNTEKERFFDELVEEVVQCKTSETKPNRMDLCTPYKSKEFYGNNDGQRSSAKKTTTPSRNFTRATQTSGNTSLAKDQTVQQLADIPSSTMKSDEFLNIRSNEMNNENLNVYPVTNTSILVNQRRRPNQNIYSTITNSEITSYGQPSETDLLVAKHFGLESYEIPIFAEIHVGNGQLVYDAIEKPVSIDPKSGEICQLFITKRVSNNMISVEFRPNAPANVNVDPVVPSSTDNQIQIISDEKLPPFFPVDINFGLVQPPNNLLQVCNVNDATACLSVNTVGQTGPVQEQPKLVAQPTSQTNTGEKRSHVRTLNFTTPPKNDRLYYEILPQNLNVPQPSGMVIAVPQSNIAQETPQLEVVIPTVPYVASNEVILTETPKASGQRQTRRTKAPVKPPPIVEKKENAKKPPAKAAASKKRQTKKAPARKPPTNVKKGSEAVPDVEVMETVTESSDKQSVQDMSQETKTETSAKNEVTSSEKAAVIQIETERRSKTDEEIQEETMRQWREMRSVPPSQMDQQLRKICSELETKKRLQTLLSPKKVKRKKKKKEETKEEESSETAVPDKLANESTETIQDVQTEKPPPIQEEKIVEDVSTSTKQDEVQIDLPIIDTENASENEPTSSVEKDGREIEKRLKESEKKSEASAHQSENRAECQTPSKSENLDLTETGYLDDQNQDTSLGQHFSESSACQALLSLDTPMKFAEQLFLPKTPCVVTPGVLSTPLIADITMQSNFSILKNPDVPTPIIAITPGRGLPSYEKSGGSSHYSVRPTDYSTGSSYYKPDESDELDKRFDTMYHSERMKSKKAEAAESSPVAEEKSSNRESCNSDDWSKSIDTVQTVIKAKKYESRVANKSNTSIESKDGSVITPCKLEKRLSKSDRSSTKSINQSMNSSSASSCCSSNSSSSSNNSSGSWSDIESGVAEETKQNMSEEKECPDGGTSKSSKGKQITKNKIATPKRLPSSNRPTAEETSTYPPANNRASKVRVGAPSHLSLLEEKRQRVIDRLKQPSHPFDRRKTPIKTPHAKHPNPKPPKPKPNLLPDRKSDRKLRSSDTAKPSSSTQQDETEETTGEATNPECDKPKRTKSKLVAQIESNLAVTPTKVAAGILKDLMENDLALTPSKDDISADEEVLCVVEETEIRQAVAQIKEGDSEWEKSIGKTPDNSVIDSKKENKLENVDAKENSALESQNEESDDDEEELEDPFDACEAVTIGEDDKLRHIRIVYKGKNGPPPPRSEKISIAHSVMNIFTDDGKHSLTVTDEIEIFQCEPVPKTKQTRRRAADTKKTTNKKTEKASTTTVPKTVTSPNKPKIKLLHKNKFNKPDDEDVQPEKEAAPKKDTKSSRCRANKKPPPDEPSRDGHVTILPLNAENIKKVMEQSKLETPASIETEDIDAILSLVHGS